MQHINYIINHIIKKKQMIKLKINNAHQQNPIYQVVIAETI
jgi:hypothetical protein